MPPGPIMVRTRKAAIRLGTTSGSLESSTTRRRPGKRRVSKATRPSAETTPSTVVIAAMRRLNQRASRIIGLPSTAWKAARLKLPSLPSPVSPTLPRASCSKRGDHGDRNESRPRQKQQEGLDAPAPAADDASPDLPRGSRKPGWRGDERAHARSESPASTAACSGSRTATLSPICQGRTGTCARSRSPPCSISTMQSWNGPA